MKSILSTLLLLVCLSMQAQNVKFSQNDDFTRVTKGTIVNIEADTAYLVSTVRAAFLNEKLDELDEIQGLYNSLLDNRNELKKELKSVQKLLSKLAKKMEADSANLSSNFTFIITDLDKTLNDLKENNQSLAQNNQDLKGRINELKRIVKDLKKETRGIWWNGLTDKLVAFAGGVGVGILLVGVL